jgi:plasmid stabilization system protein ParE
MGKKEKAVTETSQVRILNEAFHDIDQIADFIANNNQQPFNAVKVTEAIFETINMIGQNPLAYRECEQLPTKTKIYRRAVCLSWIIIYKITKPEILILGVIHGSRNPSKIRKLRKVK